MVQSLGISIGNANSYLAAGQGGGIEILLNEYSNRSTPSMVAFTDHSRSIGVDASSNFNMNMKNTIYDLMLLLGKPFKDIDSSQYSFKIEEAEDGRALVVVRHLGQERKFTITQVLGMLFTKLKDIANGATDCVISCPQFYNEIQKAELLHAALIAGLKPLQIISDMSAVVLNYAYYRTSREETHKFIAFIDFGQSNLQTVVAWLNPKEDVVRILSSESELVGGKDFDRLLADYFVKQHSLQLTPKAYLKLQSACEKLKRLLSANANETPIHVESLISEDKDFTGRIDRAKFEEICAPVLQRVSACLNRALENATANFNQFLKDVANSAKEAEVVRATESAKATEAAKRAEAAKATRVEVLKSVEAAKAARQAEQQLADQSKRSVPDDGSQANNVEQQSTDSQNTGGENSTKSAGDSEQKDTPMEIEPEELTKANAAESKAVQEAVAAKASEKSATSRANRLNKLAELKFDLQVIEMVGGSIRIPAVKQLVQDIFKLNPSTTLNTDEAVARGCVLHCATLHPGMKVKREVKIEGSELFFKPNRSVCDKELHTIEADLIESDRRYKSRTESRNNLEEYIYSERSKLQDGDQYLNALNDALDWVFSDEGEDASEEDYLNRLSELRRVAQKGAPQPTPAAEVEVNGKE